jgi:hypothetical protein
MTSALTLEHLASLRRYVASAEYAANGTFPASDRALELSTRLAIVLERADISTDADVPLVTVQDVALMERLGRMLIASVQGLRGPLADQRLALGQQLLDVRDVLRGVLIAQGSLPERRAEER